MLLRTLLLLLSPSFLKLNPHPSVLALVYEYELYGHPIMWDQENLYVHFTGIWKALGKTKADIVKIIDANPILETIIRKVRGGFLKIQGTWYVHIFIKTPCSVPDTGSHGNRFAAWRTITISRSLFLWKSDNLFL